MNKIITTVLAGALLAAPVALAPVPAQAATAAPTVTVVQSGYVKYPQAVPGRFCRAAWAGKKAKTVRYGTLTCKKKGARARWAR